MKKSLALIVAGLLGLGLVGTGAADARVSSGHPAAPSFSARCSPAVAGGHIQVLAKVNHAVRGTTFTAAATGAFSGGTAAINLRRAGKSFVAHGKITVPAGQATGPVTVGVTITYGGSPTLVSCISQIRPAGQDT